MSNPDITKKLEDIVTLSNKILNALTDEIDYLQQENEQKHTEELVEWNKKRDKLIKLTFNEAQSTHYPTNILLINKVRVLDKKLVEQAKKHQSILKNNLLKIRKNQKAAKSYKQY